MVTVFTIDHNGSAQHLLKFYFVWHYLYMETYVFIHKIKSTMSIWKWCYFVDAINHEVLFKNRINSIFFYIGLFKNFSWLNSCYSKIIHNWIQVVPRKFRFNILICRDPQSLKIDPFVLRLTKRPNEWIYLNT